MIPNPFANNALRRRAGGFTLVEMLVVVSIILGLASMVMVAMSYVRQEARAARTKATIAKINQLIMDKWSVYETRRVPVDMSGLTPAQAAEVRQLAIRYLQQFEMPDRVADFTPIPNNATSIPLLYTKTMPYPSLAKLYQARLDSMRTGGKPLNLTGAIPTVQGAMLYMICTAGNPDALEMFGEGEIGDFDNDGWPEFLDGWGHPIYFLRWAPAYDKNDFPLIYSAGPDWNVAPDNTGKLVMKGYGIDVGKADSQPNGRMPADPTNAAFSNVGGTAAEEANASFDNITNRMLEH